MQLCRHLLPNGQGLACRNRGGLFLEESQQLHRCRPLGNLIRDARFRTRSRVGASWR